ncbi:hypothetical protein D9C73_022264 [Collichthys lucidus]|uniref:Pterin-binding domain-containing protein n=1 Tax=Collichthys lucidus TaxID=240159 RepID=A0A4U5VJZ5_COLLU|nr:hypothetical protein D9C73_022264 [Collichthys lucidus]
MLLRIILCENDIRKLTIDNLPETIDDFCSILKMKLGLEGDLVIQYKDPDFDNELFDLKGSLFAGLDQYMTRFLELYKGKSGIVDLARLMRCFDDKSSIHHKRTVLLLGLPYFLKEDPSSFFKTVEATDDEETFTRGMKVGVVMVKNGEDIIDTAVVLEEAVIMTNQHDLPRAIALLMGLLFSLNIDYPKELKYTFEVIQKVLMNIGGGQCSSLDLISEC